MTSASHPKTAELTPEWGSLGEGTVVAKEQLGSISKRLDILWSTAVEWVVPYGYQDETGFHYGHPESNFEI